MEKTKQMLRVDTDNMGRIEELVHQWAILDEHFTTHSLNRHEQQKHGQRIYSRIIAEIDQAYGTRESAYT